MDMGRAQATYNALPPPDERTVEYVERYEVHQRQTSAVGNSPEAPVNSVSRPLGGERAPSTRPTDENTVENPGGGSPQWVPRGGRPRLDLRTDEPRRKPP
ncbi:MAG: hypothetical protein AAF449_24165, partial [Myxococcota bacterium]